MKQESIHYTILGAPPTHPAERNFESLSDGACPVTLRIGTDAFTYTVSVPLFLSELREFLHDLQNGEGRSIWRVEFEPFRFGYARYGGVDICLDAEGETVSAKLSADALDLLRTQVDRDIRRYGSITMTRE